MPSWFALFILADVIIIAAIVLLVVSGRLKLKAGLTVENGGADFPALLAFTREKHPRIGEYLRANWSGAPEQLPQVLESLLGDLERDAQSRGLAVDREMLTSILAGSVRAHRIARSRDLDEALRRVA